MAVETSLPPRYEIRPLGPEHLEWTKAVFAQSFMFGSPIWPVLYPEDKTARFYKIFQTADYLIRHQIASGLSLGVFDTEYEFRRPEAAAAGGGVYFDVDDATVDEAGLLAQMDNPLLSIACAFDAFDELDHAGLHDLTTLALPAAETVYRVLTERDGRDPAAWAPTARGQVVQRNGTGTRTDAQDRGLMRAAAAHLMRRAADEGFRGVQIECFHAAVNHVWTQPPEPFRARVVSEMDTFAWGETDENGEEVFPFRPVDERMTKVYVTLK